MPHSVALYVYHGFAFGAPDEFAVKTILLIMDRQFRLSVRQKDMK